ncbi:MAG: hypothetical protein MZU95_04325 [Desulfomicrobium escambiense]|nr:hypothetical protein [Desulfomicrobium escambiense]
MSTLKTMSGLDPAVYETPQLGRLEINSDDNSEKIIAGVSTFPTTKGERISIKLYKKPQKLEALNINKEDLELLSSSLNKSGLILACGSDLSFFALQLFILFSQV